MRDDGIILLGYSANESRDFELACAGIEGLKARG
jgi:hypothetical protein